MKHFINILCILLLAGCVERPEEKVSVQVATRIDSITFDDMFLSTALKIEPFSQLSQGFRLDSLFKKDTLLNHQTTLYYPVSETNPKFNQKLRRYIKSHESRFIPDKRGDEYESSVFDLWLTGFDETSKKITVKFMMQGYYPGAAHYNRDSAVFVFKKY